jgi:hypothetical protein
LILKLSSVRLLLAACALNLASSTMATILLDQMAEAYLTGIEDAKIIAQKNPNLRFELPRRVYEAEEPQDLVRMKNGELPNTMLVLSDFPSALMDAKSDVGGYNVTRKQAMLRLFHLKPDGTFKMVSRTLDLSDRDGLEAIYADFNMIPEPSELLGQRVHKQLSDEEQKVLDHKLTGIYDRKLSAKYGGEWYAGRRPADYRNTYDFVCQQDDIIQKCIEMRLNNELNNNVMYSMAATMQKRFNQGTSFVPISDGWDSFRLMEEVMETGIEARARGDTYSACGITLEMDDALKQAGYGNKTDEETNYKFDKEAYCEICQPNPGDDEPKKMCGPCGICKDCDGILRLKGK